MTQSPLRPSLWTPIKSFFLNYAPAGYVNMICHFKVNLRAM